MVGLHLDRGSFVSTSIPKLSDLLLEAVCHIATNLDRLSSRFAGCWGLRLEMRSGRLRSIATNPGKPRRSGIISDRLTVPVMARIIGILSLAFGRWCGLRHEMRCGRLRSIATDPSRLKSSGIILDIILDMRSQLDANGIVAVVPNATISVV